MKTTLLSARNILRLVLAAALLAFSIYINAQSGHGGAQTVPELVFKNPTLVPNTGSAGTDGATYKFENVTTDVNALVKIAGRSSSLVRISSIDIANTGYDNAFQPQISYNNGHAPSNRNWWMDFDVTFVNKTTGNPATVSGFNVTALDVDGDGSKLSEYVSFYNAQSYLLESNSQLRVLTLLQAILGLLTPGREFDGPTTNYTDIDVRATRVMTTLNYQNKSTFRMRAGGQTSNGSSSVADRMYSFWFKGFQYTTPVHTTLPVKLASFSATLDNDIVSLKWASAEEKNVSHFEVEKSLDGKNYSQIGMVFAYGNSSEMRHYAFNDKGINANSNGVIYYRLRSVDIDQRSEFSDVRVIKLSKQNNAVVAIQAYPNPATSTLQITVPSNWQGKKISYEVISNSGQVAMRIDAAQGSQTETLQIGKLSTGYYVVRVSCNGETAQQKIIKQ